MTSDIITQGLELKQNGGESSSVPQIKQDVDISVLIINFFIYLHKL